MKTVFLRVLEAEDKATALLGAVREPERTRARRRFEVDPTTFTSVPRSPFAYWVSDRLRGLFSELSPFEADGRIARQGLATSDDFRFVRCWWEVSTNQLSARWFPLAKGGKFSPYYADLYPVVNWRREGLEMKAFAERTPGTTHWSRNLRNTDLFFRPGLSWPLRGIRFSAQAVPSGCVFSIAGKMAFVDASELSWFLGLFNAMVFDKFIAFFAGKVGGVQYEVGLVKSIPVPVRSDADASTLESVARRSWSLRRSLDTRTETSHAFTLPALLQVAGPDVAARAATWSEHVRAVDEELVAIQAEIDKRCFALYGIDEADRRAIVEGLGLSANDEAPSDDASDADDEAAEDTDEDEVTADAVVLAAEVASWATGVAFGRLDVRLATGARPLPAEPEPFDSLPVCSPGLLTGDDGLPLPIAPAGYPLSFPEDGVLVDDPGHARDMTKAVRAVFDTVFNGDADDRWHEAAEMLDPKHRDLRNWFSNGFFEYHLKRYSKSRRKAPIIWQLSTPSSSYSVWLCAHRVNKDTFFQVQNDFVAQKLSHEERKHSELVQAAGSNPNARERKAISTQSNFVAELRTMLSEVKRIAPLWRPDLNDGVVLSMAPLWRLVPQQRAWQRELKAAWEALCAGEYNWAHVAMHLWPERVVPNCTTDRSIAIAHDLEDLFWVLDLDDHWRRLHDPPAEREHVASHWAGSARARLATQARDLWETRYRDAGRDDAHWWQGIEAGAHDDHPLAIWLWSSRVCERALIDPRIAEAHALRLPKARGRGAWLDRMSIRYGVSDEDRAFLSDAFQDRGASQSWSEWWSQLDAGLLDHLPVARYLRPHEVAKGCESSIELADPHDVRRFFFLDRGPGPRPRLTPADEQSREVAARTSAAVKAALASLLEAPAAGAVR